MNSPIRGVDYSRVNEHAAVMCRRYDLFRAVHFLGERTVDHRRWRVAFRGVTRTAESNLRGTSRAWMREAVHTLVSQAEMHPWLRAELAVDLHGSQGFEIPEVLPQWTARDVWALAEREGLPMEYITRVTEMPSGIDDEIDTAQVVLDCRHTALAHQREALSLHDQLSPRGRTEEQVPLDDMLIRIQLGAQRDAVERWRGLARRLLLVAPRGSLATG